MHESTFIGHAYVFPLSLLHTYPYKYTYTVPHCSEVNESFSPSSFRGRISLHMLSSLAKDIFPNFSYNVSIVYFVLYM